MSRYLSTSFALALLIAASGCISTDEPFMHLRDRENYAIQVDELKQIRFEISTEVFARDLSRGDSPDSVIILPEGTSGAVVDAGKNWLRVSFEEDGRGAVFLTDSSQSDDGYWLATEVEGRSGFVKLRDLPEKILRADGQSFRVIRGSKAFLIADKGDLDSVINARRHLRGRR